VNELKDIEVELKESDIMFNSNRDFIPKNESETEEKIKYIDENLKSKLDKIKIASTVVKHIFALYRYMKDPFVKWYKKTVVVAGLLYFIFPFDTIPDVVPIVGYLDDFGVILAVVKFIGSELNKYYGDQL